MRYNESVGEEMIFEVEPAAAGDRLDRFLAGQIKETSRSFVKRLIDDELVTLSSGKAKPASKLRGGERVTLFLPELVAMSAEPEAIPLDVLFEDSDLIVLNKPAGRVCHPSVGHENGTLVNALLHHCGDLSGIGGELRPGIVHRLDRDTSGCIVCAKNDLAHQELSAQFAGRTTEKRYLAITVGTPRPACGKVEGQIGRHLRDRQKQAMLPSGGRYSLTLYETLAEAKGHALVSCDIKTGRTHQIRVHLKHVHAPILCDADYGKGAELHGDSGEVLIGRQALHAYRLTLSHPRTEERMTFTAPLHEDMRLALGWLGVGYDLR